MEERPKVKLQLTTTEQVIEIVSLLLLLSIWILTIQSYASMPDTIPIHYDASGQADGFGSKGNIWMLCIIATLLYAGLTVLNKFPHIFNYPAHITKQNAVSQYTAATRLLRYLKLVIVVIFGLISFKTIQNTEGHTEGLGIWFLPLTLALIFIPLIYFVVRSGKSK